MTTPLFLLRCIEIGISIRDLDLLSIGLVLDIWTEKANDGVKIRENGIPFSLKLDVPNETTAAAIEEGRRIATDSSVKGYSDMESLKKALEV
jgi:hypothetical protein